MTKYNGTEVQGMTYNGQEVETWIHNGVEVYAGLSGKYVIENSILNEKFASGEFMTESSCAGNTTGTSSKVALTLVDKLVGKPMKMTFRGYTSANIYNKDVERYVYVECNGVQLAKIDLLVMYGGSNKDETVTVEFTPASNVIYVGTYVRRTSDTAQASQKDIQTAIITELQIL